MITKNKARITKDAAGKKVKVVKKFDADVQQVWDAWTNREMLDKWWAPKPWRAETKEMDFREGGKWLYRMVGPKGESESARLDYNTIDAPKSFTSTDSFVDEDGNNKQNSPSMRWETKFIKTSEGTTVEVEIKFDKDDDMKKILDMGFEEGFAAALENLDELLAQ